MQITFINRLESLLEDHGFNELDREGRVSIVYVAYIYWVSDLSLFIDQLKCL